MDFKSNALDLKPVYGVHFFLPRSSVTASARRSPLPAIFFPHEAELARS
jgi:hypothetical protein